MAAGFLLIVSNTKSNQCDERYPSCFNCSRRGSRCSFSVQSSLNQARSPSRTSNDTIASNTPAVPIRVGTLNRNHGPNQDSDLNPMVSWDALELMHHYTNTTANTLAARPDMQYTWRVTIPELAYTCHYLMHGILSISALHLAYLVPTRRRHYLDVAANYQVAGLEGFRSTLSVVNGDNWKECFCFSSLIAISACMLPLHTISGSAETVPDTLGLFAFVRGMRTVISPYQSSLGGTVLSSLLNGVWIINVSDPSYR